MKQETYINKESRYYNIGKENEGLKTAVAIIMNIICSVFVGGIFFLMIPDSSFLGCVVICFAAIGLILMIADKVLENDDKDCLTVQIANKEDIISNINYFVEKVLREERIKSKRIDYYEETEQQPYTSYLEFADNNSDNRYIIVWRKKGKAFEIAQWNPEDKLIAVVETFGKRTDRVINEVNNAIHEKIWKSKIDSLYLQLEKI